MVGCFCGFFIFERNEKGLNINYKVNALIYVLTFINLSGARIFNVKAFLVEENLLRKLY